MKKFIMAVGLLLVAAVFMSGCVTETEDPIVGIWNDYSPVEVVGVASTSMIFNADGTGFSLTHFEGELASAKVDITWKNEGDGKYILERPAIWDVVGISPQYLHCTVLATVPLYRSLKCITKCIHIFWK